MDKDRKKAQGRPSSYSAEFQRDAVARVLDEGRSISDVAGTFGVNVGTLTNWVGNERRDRNVAASASTEIARLRREITSLRLERDLLKRSLAHWMSRPKT
jgi:transposase